MSSVREDEDADGQSDDDARESACVGSARKEDGREGERHGLFGEVNVTLVYAAQEEDCRSHEEEDYDQRDARARASQRLLSHSARDGIEETHVRCSAEACVRKQRGGDTNEGSCEKDTLLARARVSSTVIN